MKTIRDVILDTFMKTEEHALNILKLHKWSEEECLNEQEVHASKCYDCGGSVLEVLYYIDKHGYVFLYPRTCEEYAIKEIL